MIVIMKRGTPQKEIDKLSEALIAKGVEVNPVVGKDLTIDRKSTRLNSSHA